MTDRFLYLANGRLHLFRDGRSVELVSHMLDDYLTRVKDAARRNEWKYSGSGAAFTGTLRAGADAESSVAAVHSRVCCVARHGNDLLYSLEIDRTCGIYRKYAEDAGKEGIVLSSGDNAYRDFDVCGDRIVLTSAFGGESHIGVMPLGSSMPNIYTEGATWDSAPVWSAHHPDQIYFCSAGLPVQESEKPTAPPTSYGEMAQQMYTAHAAASRPLGPTAICLLDIASGTMDELLSDGRYDYTHPQSTPDGALYYIRKPYRVETRRANPLGCLFVPFRLIGALFGFLNVFSAKYSGKTLSKGGDVKQRDEGQMFIDGNLINAERELQANRKRGEAEPGIIPHSWELRRREADGRDTLVRAGVVAYRVLPSGDILLSNGSAVLCRDAEGKERKVLSAQKVTFIR